MTNHNISNKNRALQTELVNSLRRQFEKGDILRIHAELNSKIEDEDLKVSYGTLSHFFRGIIPLKQHRKNAIQIAQRIIAERLEEITELSTSEN